MRTFPLRYALTFKIRNFQASSGRRHRTPREYRKLVPMCGKHPFVVKSILWHQCSCEDWVLTGPASEDTGRNPGQDLTEVFARPRRILQAEFQF